MSSFAGILLIAAQAAAPALVHERTFEPLTVVDPVPTSKSIWHVNAAGDAVHAQSTLVCPARAGQFKGGHATVHDGFGLDVSCSFDLPHAARITIFLTKRTGQSLQDDFNATRAAIAAHRPNQDLSEIQTDDLVGPPNFLSTSYALDDGNAAMGVWMADLSGWTLKYRAFYVESAHVATIEALVKLVNQMRTTAAVHLAACAAAPPVVRSGTQITDRELTRRLSLIAGMSEQAGDESITPLPKNERWCVESKIEAREAPMLYWRNVANNGADGPVDRLTLMTEEEPPTWLISANATASMLVDARDGPGALIHQLTEPRDGKVFMFTYYRGRPSLTTLAPLVRSIIAGQVRPIAKYDPATNTVTLPKGPKPGN
ncbi:MAG: hypothetical protein SGI91_10435 [Alphaproteobacteria bacterium]|nr:hypothetical protein [Alphaproteobacteria bacterium]